MQHVDDLCNDLELASGNVKPDINASTSFLCLDYDALKLPWVSFVNVLR